MLCANVSGVACHGKRRGVMVEIGLMVVRSVGVGSNRVGRKDVRWLYEGSLRCEEGRESSLLDNLTFFQREERDHSTRVTVASRLE